MDPRPARVTVLVGAQWGDEGKGKWIDILAADADLVVRYQGGNNAGHTLYVEGRKIVLHQLPSGLFHPRQTSALTSGVVVNPAQLVMELDRVASFGVDLSPERLWLSGRAHVITPWHIHLDELREGGAGTSAIGTTKRGIGPTYADKMSRTGLRLGHYVDAEARGRWSERMRAAMPGFREHEASHAEAWAAFHDAAARLRPFVTDAEAKVRAVCAQTGPTAARVLLEGAQGTLLDIDHGTYPYVTSSSTGSGGACQSVGLAPKLIGGAIGIAKGYVTRVGAGPFPTELSNAIGQQIASKGQEFGATTGRPRRVGWLDAVALRYVVQVNGLDGLVLNKLDVLTGLAEVKIATAYDHPRLGRLTTMPWDTEVLSDCTPVYESYPGWDEPLVGGGTFAELPAATRHFVAAAEAHAGAPVMMVGTGPGRGDAVYRG